MTMDGELKFKSWKSREDPGVGEFTFLQADQGYNIFQSSTLYWKSGTRSVDSLNPSTMFPAAVDMLEGKSRISLTEINPRIVMNYTREIQYLSWDKSNRKWILEWSAPSDDCSVYNACGPFGICNAVNKNSSRCSCMRGFSPSDPEIWGFKNFSTGCKRMSEICMDNNPTDYSDFTEWNIRRIENPTIPVSLQDNEEDCRTKCIKDCNCQAYSYYGRKFETYPQVPKLEQAGNLEGAQFCWIWTSDLIDLQVGEPGSGALILAIRDTNSTVSGRTAPKQLASNGLERSPRKPKSSSLKFIIAVTVAIVISFSLLLATSVFAFRRMVAKKRGEKERSSELEFYDNRRLMKDLLSLGQTKEDDTEGIGVPFFKLETILAATNGLSDSNKLGQGGFGPVYKGTLPQGLELAVKRLSSHSGQGLDEFKNEVVLIAKLQHRNLVKLLGYCIEGNEKMLIYEFMPNKSLDTFIFDRTRCTLLDWTKRYDIILGITRGLLYLHQDSRLRIIHRDLKTSNILLDEDMNPKISDFGLAKIVTGKNTEASTKRVMDTYGYMSPEYVLDGLFSFKSDVFSFGVVVLEIISGQRNTGFYQSQKALSLIGYAWSLWKQDAPLDLVDETLVQSYNSTEALQCIIIGLLCIQENPSDRPNMGDVVNMLQMDVSSLPNPKKPAFVSRRLAHPGSSSCSSYRFQEMQSNNELTISLEDGR